MGILCSNITVNVNGGGGNAEGDVSTSGTSSSGVVSGSKRKILEQLFDGRVPTYPGDESWVKGYMTTIKAGGFNITVHKKVANDVKNIINDIVKAGYKLKAVGGYQWRKVNNGKGSNQLSMHGTGAALDINCYQISNGYVNGFVKAGMANSTPNQNDLDPGRIRTNDHVVCKIFQKYGWGWGGRYGDFMHFSLANGS